MIVSNWTGYIDVLYLAFRYVPLYLFPKDSTHRALYRFNPTYLLPMHEALPPASGTGTPRAQFKGYVPVNLTTILSLTGHTPSLFRTRLSNHAVYPTLTEARIACHGRPLVVFPEATTSNARGLLRFSQGCLADVEVPVRGFNVWVMFFKCVPSPYSPLFVLILGSERHPSPTPWTPTATHSAPNTILNPLLHVATTLCQSLIPRTLTVRILHPHNAPSSGAFLPSETLDLTTATTGEDRNVLGDCCAVLLRQLGRVKSVGMGWEEKDGFLTFLRERRPTVVGLGGGGKKVGKGRAR